MRLLPVGGKSTKGADQIAQSWRREERKGLFDPILFWFRWATCVRSYARTYGRIGSIARLRELFRSQKKTDVESWPFPWLLFFLTFVSPATRVLLLPRRFVIHGSTRTILESTLLTHFTIVICAHNNARKYKETFTNTWVPVWHSRGMLNPRSS